MLAPHAASRRLRWCAALPSAARLLVAALQPARRLAALPLLAASLALVGTATTSCSSHKDPNAPPVGQTRADAATSPEDDPPPLPEVEEEEELEVPGRLELNALAAEQEEARHAAWARKALAEIASPTNDLGVVVVVAQRAADLPWLLAIQNRGERPVSVAALPDLLTFEVVPKERAAAAAEPAPTTTRTTKTPAPPPPIWCGEVPKSVAAEGRVTLLPSEILVYPFDPRGYCDSSDVLVQGATIKPRYGFPLETKKVWRQGKQIEEVLPPKAPLAFELAQDTAPVEDGALPAPATSPETPPATLQLKHIEAQPFVLDETYPLELITPKGRIEPALAQTSASAQPQAAQATADAAASGAASGADEEPTRPRPPPPPPLTLTIRPLGTTSAPSASTVTVTAKNTSGRSMRLYLRRELISYQVTGPKGPVTCRMATSARAPSPTAYSSLAPGASLNLTTRLAEACPKGTFDMPGSYTVFARIDAMNDGREHGFIAFTGTAITAQPATLTVRGTNAQARPVMRITSGR